MNPKDRWQRMIESIDSDLIKLQSALTLLNQVWITKPDSQDGLIVAIKHIGSEIALLQRKKVEAEYFKNNRSFEPKDSVEIPDEITPLYPSDSIDK